MSQPKFPSFNEQKVEYALLDWLNAAGWDTYGGPDEPDGCTQLDAMYGRDDKSEVVYWELLREQLIALNEPVTSHNVDDVITSLRRDFAGDGLMETNRNVQEVLQKGRQVTLSKSDGTSEAAVVDLIDHETPENNALIAANQFRVRQHELVIPDMVLFVNGIPLVVTELKSLTQDSTVTDAIEDIHDYEGDAPRLFSPVLFNVAADHERARYGAVNAPETHYNPWQPEDPTGSPSELKEMAHSLLTPGTLLDILKHFVFYQRQPGGDAKIIPRHMQYHGTQAILHRVSRGQFENGLIWHTQGSGKSFTMFFTARNLLYRPDIIKTPQVLILVDRQNLRDQMSDDLGKLIDFDHYEIVTDGADQLQSLIEEGQSQVVVTTIQLFQDVDENIQENDETVVLSDEAHRFMEAKLGSKLDNALHSYYHFGFTGTPVNENTEAGRNTFQHYSEPRDEDGYLHHYSMEDGINDDVILPVHFELRHGLDWEIDDDVMDQAHEAATGDLDFEKRDKLIRETINQQTLAELRSRRITITEEIVDHYREKLAPSGWKGMVVTPSRKAAALYGEELQKYLDPEEVRVVISSAGKSDPITRTYHTSKSERERIVEEFKDEDGNPKILVVCSMLLTGFDAPILKTIYLDRPLTNHNLLQAIARTNRPAEGKENGEIVDFAGVFAEGNVEEALSYYPPDVREAAAEDVQELLDRFDEKLEEAVALFDHIDLDDGPETVVECLTYLRKDAEARRRFKELYRDVENLYDTLAPMGELEDRDTGRPQKYSWLTQVYLAYQRSMNRESEPERRLREKTKEIVENNVDVDRMDEEFEVVEFGADHLERVRDMDAEQGITEVAGAADDYLDDRSEHHPRYRRLSERVREVVDKWESDEVTADRAYEELVELEEEILSVEDEAEERGLSPSGHALFAALMDDSDEGFAEYIEDEDEAEFIAKRVDEELAERVDTSYTDWETSTRTREDIQKLLLEVVAIEAEKPDLCKDDRFLEDAREYLIENHPDA
ncbi:type I restriction endonuclease subunit R [Natrinema sp. 74]|uniref:type I restriction endonuclease subunit R n=1 Tax=Natrinema sp. 74 TaxID=3384159 RepID=UPI0038D44647